MIRAALASLTLLLEMTSLSKADEQTPVSEKSIEAFQSRFDALRDQQKESKTLIEAADEADNIAPAIIGESFDGLNVQYLRALMNLERNLILLTTPPAKLDKDLDIPGLSSTECSRIFETHAEIHAAERERINTALQHNSPLHGDENAEKSILKKEARLDAIFEKAAKKFDREIKEIQRDLAKEEKSSIPDDKEIASLCDDLDAAVTNRKKLFLPIFGHPAESGFDTTGPLSPKSAEDLRLAMEAERERVLKELRNDAENEGEDEKKSGVIGGSHVYSSNLGVILDVSGSMTRFIEPLKEEIAKSFEHPHYKEVIGCKLREDTSVLPKGPVGRRGEHTMGSIEELIVVRKVDTVYWFCDLQDGFTSASIRRLRYFLHRSGVAFHVKSVGKRPERELEKLITDFQRG